VVDAVVKVGGRLGHDEGLRGLCLCLGELGRRHRLLVVPGGGEGRVSLSLALPATTVVKTAEGPLLYRLTLRKQPGLSSLPVTLRVTPPQGSSTFLPEGWFLSPSGDLGWSGAITQTEVFELYFLYE